MAIIEISANILYLLFFSLSIAESMMKEKNTNNLAKYRAKISNLKREREPADGVDLTYVNQSESRRDAFLYLHLDNWESSAT